MTLNNLLHIFNARHISIVSVQLPVLFLYRKDLTCNSKKKVLKYLGINVAKNVQNLHKVNFKIL